LSWSFIYQSHSDQLCVLASPFPGLASVPLGRPAAATADNNAVGIASRVGDCISASGRSRVGRMPGKPDGLRSRRGCINPRFPTGTND
jgi:hypothetical protein